MAAITRCRECLTLVYQGSQTCHHCGCTLKRSRRQVLPRGSGKVILAAVVLFAAADTIFLVHERRNRVESDQAQVQDFLERLLRGDRAGASRLWARSTDPLDHLQEEVARLGSGTRLWVSSFHPLGKSEIHYGDQAGELLQWPPANRYRFDATVRQSDRARIVLRGEACVEKDVPHAAQRILCLSLFPANQPGPIPLHPSNGAVLHLPAEDGPAYRR